MLTRLGYPLAAAAHAQNPARSAHGSPGLPQARGPRVNRPRNGASSEGACRIRKRRFEWCGCTKPHRHGERRRNNPRQQALVHALGAALFAGWGSGEGSSKMRSRGPGRGQRKLHGRRRRSQGPGIEVQAQRRKPSSGNRQRPAPPVPRSAKDATQQRYPQACPKAESEDGSWASAAALAWTEWHARYRARWDSRRKWCGQQSGSGRGSGAARRPPKFHSRRFS